RSTPQVQVTARATTRRRSSRLPDTRLLESRKASFPDAFRPGTLYADARLQFQEPSSMWGMPAGNGVSEVNSYKASPCARSSAAPTLGARPHVRNAVQDAAAAAA
ncbi:unnamed protein product, partial [Effrenium voratum]